MCRNVIVFVVIIFLVKSVSWATQPEQIAKGRISYLTLSTDKQSILYFNEDNHNQGKFYSYSLKTKNIHILSKRNFNNISLVRWSSDRSKIAYIFKKQCWIYNFKHNEFNCLGSNIIPHDWSPDQTKILCTQEDFFTTKGIKNYNLTVYDTLTGSKNSLEIISRERWSQETFWIGNKILYVYPQSDVRNTKALLVNLQSKAKEMLVEGVYGPKNTVSSDMSKIIFGFSDIAGNCTLPQLRIKNIISGEIINLPINAKVKSTGWLSENEIIYFSKRSDSKDTILANYQLNSQNNHYTILDDVDVPFEVIVSQNLREVFFTANLNSQTNSWGLYQIKM